MNAVERDAWPDVSWAFMGVLLLAFMASSMTIRPTPVVAAQATGDTIVASAARLSGDRDQTRFVADLSEGVAIRAFALADPHRIIIDLPEVAFHLPNGIGQKGRGLVTGYRYGQFAPGKSRIVLDVDRPVVIEDAFVQSAELGQPARLIVDLKATTEADFARRLASSARPDAFPRSNSTSKTARLNVLPTPRPERVGPTPEDRPVVVIDPGHGGVDPGAIGPRGTREKDIVLKFSRLLREKLEATGNFEVRMTRDDDRFIPLHDRVQYARSAEASLFISIHADSFRSRRIRGATIYTVSDKASDEEAAAVAERENKADLIAGIDLRDEPDAVSDILFDLAVRETRNLSVGFAQTLVTSLRPAVRLNKNPHRFAGFRVLKAHDVPSVLLELGYLSNREDERRLRDPKWREGTANAVAKAVRQFLLPQFAGASQ